MKDSIRDRQIPGRQWAMREALGKTDASPLVKHIAGLDKVHQRQPPRPALATFTATSGLDKLTPAERSALPF